MMARKDEALLFFRFFMTGKINAKGKQMYTLAGDENCYTSPNFNRHTATNRYLKTSQCSGVQPPLFARA